MSIHHHRSIVSVLGAGIMGCLLALELAKRGYLVDLYDCKSKPITGASLHNEGKLHLGFVYANDPLKATHSMLLRGSMSFSRIIKELTGCQTEALVTAKPFHYFVPIDSQLDMDKIEKYFHEVEDTIFEYSQNSGDYYLDRKIDKYFERNSLRDHNKLFSSNMTQGSFKTEEISISTVHLSHIIRRTIQGNPNITFLGNTEILGVERLPNDTIHVELQHNSEISTRKYACVANCLWDDKIRVDKTAGIHDQTPWLLRYKAMINISLQSSADMSDIPSATGILGAYGDVVNLNSGSFYISWYPLCKITQTNTGEGRELPDKVHKGLLPHHIRKWISHYPMISNLITSVTHKNFINQNISEMSVYIPSLKRLLRCKKQSKLTGGIILAKGLTDIDDPKSNLHQRSEIGPRAYGSYVTVDTGKYCMAPLFATETADLITTILN